MTIGLGKRGTNERANKVPSEKRGGRTTVGGGAVAKYEVEIPRTSVAQGGEWWRDEVPGGEKAFSRKMS